MAEGLKVPMYYEPRPYQRDAWARRLSGQFDYYFKIWGRQEGKDTDDIQKAMHFSWDHPGTQTAYVGLDNKWIRRNIWDKYLDGRKHWDNYPADMLDIKETQQQIKFLNNPEDKAEALIQFIGFKESESLIGSSYESFYVSELSLYRRGAFDFIMPIWENKAAMGQPLSVNFNFTPRGMNNVAADMLRTYTGEDDPAKWPGAHGRVYVDVVRADQATLADGSKLWSPEALENVRQRYIRAHGNDNMFRQEFMCEFLAVNAGLVYPGIEVLRAEGRFTPHNLRTDKPVYMAWDISSKDKQSDWTAGIVFQYIDGKMFIYDYYEDNRKAVVECVQELAKRPYFHLIRAACLPWDSDRSGSQHSPLEECRQMFPNIQWRKLERTYVADGINRVRKLLPNMVINSDKCDWVMECFESWEYKELSSVDDWAATPKHDRYSHIMDATRYCAEMIEQLPYIRTSDGGPKEMPLRYPAWGEESDDKYSGVPAWMRPSKLAQKKKPNPGSGAPSYSPDW